MADRFFGEVPGFSVGATFVNRMAISQAGVHRPPQPGISGTAAEGADSIVVNGGYEDDRDYGEEIIYTGAGGNDPGTGKQVEDQTLTHTNNAGLVTSELEGLPVRVIRGPNGDPAYSPVSGYRYDGLYRVADHWSEIGLSGFLIWRFQLLRLSDDEVAPFVPPENLPEGNPAPAVKTGVVTRVVRSTLVSDWVKKLYDGRCQMCDVRLVVPGGLVAEGAHIRALGSPHGGPDVVSNVLCLCPNDHSRFDKGGLYIEDDLTVRDFNGLEVGKLTVHTKHTVDVEQLQYHRGLWAY